MNSSVGIWHSSAAAAVFDGAAARVLVLRQEFERDPVRFVAHSEVRICLDCARYL